MSGFQLSERIDRPVDDVFAFATNPDNAGLWLGDVTRIELLTPGPLRAGTKFRETRRIGKHEHSAVIEITAHEPPHTHAASASMMGVTANYRYTFAPEGDGTRVEMTAEVQARGLAKLLVPKALSEMKKLDGDQLVRLKRAIEAA